MWVVGLRLTKWLTLGATQGAQWEQVWDCRGQLHQRPGHASSSLLLRAWVSKACAAPPQVTTDIPEHWFMKYARGERRHRSAGVLLHGRGLRINVWGVCSAVWLVAHLLPPTVLSRRTRH